VYHYRASDDDALEPRVVPGNGVGMMSKAELLARINFSSEKERKKSPLSSPPSCLVDALGGLCADGAIALF
jgi:hypothetical protein